MTAREKVGHVPTNLGVGGSTPPRCASVFNILCVHREMSSRFGHHMVTRLGAQPASQELDGIGLEFFTYESWTGRRKLL
jgi:hypothetical protein